jgi:emp24/gp25L/p24 family/GOLD
MELAIIQFAICLLLALCCLRSASAIAFHLPPNVKKCLRDEVQKDNVVKGEFELSVTSPEIKTDLLVRSASLSFLAIIPWRLHPQILDSKGNKLYGKEDAQKGKFAFSVDEYEMIEVCFETKFEVRKYIAPCFIFWLLDWIIFQFGAAIYRIWTCPSTTARSNIPDSSRSWSQELRRCQACLAFSIVDQSIAGSQIFSSSLFFYN